MMDGFDKAGFIAWLKEEFPGCLDTHWHWDLVENILEYADKYKNFSRDQLAYFVSDMLPEVSFLDAARFCGSGCLTNGTREALGREQE